MDEKHLQLTQDDNNEVHPTLKVNNFVTYGIEKRTPFCYNYPHIF